MSGLFSAPKPKMQASAAPPPTPTVDQAIVDQTESDRLARRRGRAANMLTRAREAAPATSAAKMLLGT